MRHGAERSPIDRARVERALKAVARRVAEPGGEVLVPVFERLEQELARLDKEAGARARAEQLAGTANERPVRAGALVTPRPGPSTRPAARGSGRRRI